MIHKAMGAFDAGAPNDDWAVTAMPNAAVQSADSDSASSSVTHLELVRLVERVNRRYADLLRVELTRLGIDDVSCAQVMLLFTIGDDELTVRDLLERGHYLGSNASYNLKQLVEGGYVDRSASQRDRRSARLRLSEKGQQLCRSLGVVDETYHRLIARDEDEIRDLETTYRTLRRLELIWTSTLRYGEP
ncbi:MarR family winged helix-turn-helix transcriptional regulator [Agaricicola taiwanensis]|nr:MarR family transcriptional regulator [Agaricicola taiwanensis]